MFKLSLMASMFFAMEIIIFFMVSNYYGIETVGAGAGAGMVTLAGIIALAGALALAGAEEKTIFSFWKTLFFVLLMEVFMGVVVFMIIKNIPMGMFAIRFACMFPILVSGYDLVLQFNGEKGLFTKKEEVAEMQAS